MKSGPHDFLILPDLDSNLGPSDPERYGASLGVFPISSYAVVLSKCCPKPSDQFYPFSDVSSIALRTARATGFVLAGKAR